MPLKTLVKVGSISNLSDARYCAGMGVDLLGFRVIEGADHYIDVKLFQQVRGWVAGPKTVAEMYGMSETTDINAVIENYAPDYFEINASEYLKFKEKLTLPLIVSAHQSELSQLPNNDTNIAFFIIKEEDTLPIDNFNHGNALLKITNSNGLNKVTGSNVFQGIALDGSPEIRPGYKDYEELSEILELLDE